MVKIRSLINLLILVFHYVNIGNIRLIFIVKLKLLLFILSTVIVDVLVECCVATNDFNRFVLLIRQEDIS